MDAIKKFHLVSSDSVEYFESKSDEISLDIDKCRLTKISSEFAYDVAHGHICIDGNRAKSVHRWIFKIIDAANKPALNPPSMAKQPIGTPFGIMTIESKESKPFSFLLSTGTPSTGRVVKDETIPAR